MTWENYFILGCMLNVKDKIEAGKEEKKFWCCSYEKGGQKGIH